MGADYIVPVTVAVLALFNFMFLVVRPRIFAKRAEGITGLGAFRMLSMVVKERPFITVLVVIQLAGTSRAATTAVKLFQWSIRDHRDPRTGANLSERLMLTGILMSVISLVWLLSAIGIWLSRRWAWVLSLVLNGLAATVTVALQLLNTRTYLIDAPALVALVVLLLPIVRIEYYAVDRNSQRT